MNSWYHLKTQELGLYMKTKNIWTISMVHFINNNLAHVLYWGRGTNMVVSWESIVFKLVIFSIIYIPFLLSKAYKDSPNYYNSNF